MVAALLLAVALAHPTTAANRAEARRDAAALLGRVVLPSGARRLAHAPGHAGGLLGRAFQMPAGELVDRHRLWRADEPLRSVVAFVETHPPRGAQRQGSGSGSSGGPGVPDNKTFVFSLPGRPGRISSRWLDVTLVALPDGSTGVRADAQDVWIVTRPPSGVVPLGVREIDVGSAGTSHRVTRPRAVATIVRWFDALPIVQPGGAFHCPALVYGPVVQMSFRDAAGALLARARMPMRFRNESLLSTSCTAIQFSVGDRKETPLVGGRFFLRVERLLGIRLR